MALALLAVSAAHGQSGESKGSPDASSERIVKRMDRSGDGKIDHEEFRNAMMRRFTAADANSDGVLKGSEIPAHSLVVKKSDAVSGEVRQADYSSALQPVFDRFDADQDGMLGHDEIQAMSQARGALKDGQP